jgi:creatinine amidohydrolase
VLITNASWPNLKILADSILVLPIGAIEAHGPHLPLGTDAIVSSYLATRLEENREHQIFVLPTLSYGCQSMPARTGGTFPGRFGVKMSTFLSVVGDILDCGYDQNFRSFLVIDCHMANQAPIAEAAEHFRQRAPDTRIMAVSWWDFAKETTRNRISSLSGVERDADHHAATVESSLICEISPDLVGKVPDRPDFPQEASRYFVSPYPERLRTRYGVVNDATAAHREIGRELLQEIAGSLVQAVGIELGPLTPRPGKSSEVHKG